MRGLGFLFVCFFTAFGAFEQAAAADNGKPHAGQLYGKTKIPYTLHGEALPAGSYVLLAYDAGDDWVLADESDSNLQRISKADVDVVPRVDFIPNLTGRMIAAQTTISRYPPSFRKAEDRLERIDKLLEKLRPTAHLGDEISIQALEYNYYIVSLPNGDAGKLGKVPVGLIQITSGNPESGTPVFIPPLPETTSAKAPESITSAPAPSSAPAPAPAPTPAPPYEFRFYGVPFLKTLYTRVVGLLTAPPYEFTFYGVPVVKTWQTLGVGIFLAMVAFGLWDFVASRFLPPRRINPKKWFYDQETGEYYRITSTDRDGLLVDQSPYSKRYTFFLRKKSELKRARLMIIATYVVAPVFAYLMMDKAHIISITKAPQLELAWYGWLLLFGVIALMAGGLFISGFFVWLGGELWYLNAKERDLGPPPIPPRGLEDVERQKAYGDANAAGVADIHAALSGNAPATAGARAAPTGPIYDE